MPTGLRSLTRRRDFDSVFREGISQTSKHLVIYARPNELEINRVGLAVSRKVGKAVARNRIRRLLRESLRKVFADVPRRHDFVLIATRHTADGTFDDFVREMERLAKRLYEKNSDIRRRTL
ncbi:MAG: ribonuclease P protein component [Nitrospirota bacterium]